jgi:hypothetical protein
MRIIPISKNFSGTAARGLLASIGAGAILLAATLAFAQDGGNSAPAAAEKPGFFGAIGRWLDDQTSTLGSHLKGARTGVENLGNEAGVAAKTTVEGAKDAAGAVTRIPTSRVFTGHEQCASAPNGAPDCVIAANAICKTNGFESGKSVDTTTTEVCPPQVYLSGQSSGPECRKETFVSRALCQ